MADGVYIVLKHAMMLSATTHHARSGLCTVLVAAVTSRKARDKFARTDDLKHALCTAHASR